MNSSSSSNPSAPTSSSPQHSSCEIGNDAMAKSGATDENDCCHNAASAAAAAASADSRFSCNICFDEVQEPVVTRCGHLYCWQCLFQWLEPGMRPEERESLGMSSFRYGGTNPSRRVCPVCKSECPLSAVVPVYVRSPSKSKPKRSEAISEPSNKSQTTEENENETNTSGIELDEPENDSNLNAPHESEIMGANEGLRQRRTNRTSNDSNNSTNDNAPIHVPNRPAVTYPEEPASPPMSRRSSPISSPRPNASTDNPYRAGAVQITPRSPNGHNGSLTYGILSSLQRATAEYYRNNNNNNNNNNDDDEPDRRRIPSLHDRRNPLSNHNADGSGRFGESSQSYSNYDERHGIIDSETTATQYLSRLLIMLASFVIFCFLMV